MNSTCTMTESAQAASQILAAVQNRDLDELESGLDRAERLADCPRPPKPHAIERLELLSAVAEEMRASINRFERRLTPRLEGVEVHLQLLRHLAYSPPANLTPHA